MSQFMIILLSSIIIAGAVTGGVVWYLSRKIEELKLAGRNDQGMQFLNHNLQALQQSFNDRLDNTARVMMAVTSELGQMREIGHNLKNIQDFLKSPKLRGNLGEQGLRELLSQALPNKYFDIQYPFRNGTIVDAIIHLEAGKIPVDAKFPLENFNLMLKAATEVDQQFFRRKFKEDFKKHILAISSKYINPDEGTTDFAFMYIPSESIYFEVVNNESELFDLATREHIVISSPSTFFYYLKTIMLGLEGKRITEMSREIIKSIKTIKLQSRALGENISTLSRHINNAQKTMSTTFDQYSKLSQKIDTVDLLEEGHSRLLEDHHEG